MYRREAVRRCRPRAPGEGRRSSVAKYLACCSWLVPCPPNRWVEHRVVGWWRASTASTLRPLSGRPLDPEAAWAMSASSSPTSRPSWKAARSIKGATYGSAGRSPLGCRALVWHAKPLAAESRRSRLAWRGFPLFRDPRSPSGRRRLFVCRAKRPWLVQPAGGHARPRRVPKAGGSPRRAQVVSSARSIATRNASSATFWARSIRFAGPFYKATLTQFLQEVVVLPGFEDTLQLVGDALVQVFTLDL